MRLLLTGASGQLGAYLLRHLHAEGADVVAWSGQDAGERFGTRLLPVDLGDPGAAGRGASTGRAGAVGRDGDPARRRAGAAEPAGDGPAAGGGPGPAAGGGRGGEAGRGAGCGAAAARLVAGLGAVAQPVPA